MKSSYVIRKYIYIIEILEFENSKIVISFNYSKSYFLFLFVNVDFKSNYHCI